MASTFEAVNRTEPPPSVMARPVRGSRPRLRWPARSSWLQAWPRTVNEMLSPRPGGCEAGPRGSDGVPSRRADVRGRETAVEVRLLGPVEIWANGRPVELGPPQRRHTLAA